MTEQDVRDARYRGSRYRGVQIPEHMIGAALSYFNEHQPPGDFLRAVLENDLMEAYRQADDENVVAMHAWVVFLYNEAPIGSYGSPENVKVWLASRQVTHPAPDEKR